eukprot:1159388-Pelagomonas_calceolata.AAC.10
MCTLLNIHTHTHNPTEAQQPFIPLWEALTHTDSLMNARMHTDNTPKKYINHTRNRIPVPPPVPASSPPPPLAVPQDVPQRTQALRAAQPPRCRRGPAAAPGPHSA